MRTLLLLAVAAVPALADEKLAGKACRSVHVAFSEKAEAVAFVHEIVVEQSAPGTYFAVCGFNKGYFGIQELANGKKLVIFSIWDPAFGDDQKKVPDEKRVKLISKGEKTRVGRFGNEGTGGQSFLDFDWKIGNTYRFCVTAAKDGDDRTAFHAHFQDATDNVWIPIASFSTITKGKLLGGYYSFVEDFRRNGESLKQARKADFRNGWIVTSEGKMIELTTARFTADSNPATNIDAGPTKTGFFLATGGATENTTTKLKESMTRQPSGTAGLKLPGK
jgi:hypothetical protein